jgi:hypothetical protein
VNRSTAARVLGPAPRMPGSAAASRVRNLALVHDRTYPTVAVGMMGKAGWSMML